MKIVITGSSGFIGGELARRFQETGQTVGGIDVQPGAGPLNDFQLAGLGGEVSSAIFQNTDLVVHAAHDMSRESGPKNISGTKLWFQQAKQAGVRRQLFLTSYSAHASAPSEYGQTKYSLERFFIDQEELILRPGLVIGPGGSFYKLAQFLARGKLVPVLGGDAVKLALTDMESVFQVINRFESLPAGRVLNLFHPDRLGLWEMTRLIRRLRHARGWAFPVPVGMSKGLLKTAERLGVKLPNSYENFMALLKSQHYGYTSSYAELGVQSERPADLIEENLLRS